MRSLTPGKSAATPWVAILYSAIEPVGRRGGGIHNAVIGQAIGLIANGVPAKILTSSEACAAEAKERGIAADLDPAWQSGIDPMLSKRLWRRACRQGGRLPAAVIHNSGRTWFAGPFMFPGVTQVQVLHREVIYPYRGFRNWMALSETYARSLRASPSGWFRRIVTAPNGLLDNPQPPKKRNRSGPVTFGTVGRMGEIKGTDILIDAASIVQRHGSGIRFKLVGDGGKGFRARVEQAGLSEIVELIGWTDDIDSFLDSIDVFLLPSRKETFGIAVIEAMARGLPIVSTATNGAQEIVTPGESGWLVPIGDPDALAAIVQEVAADRAEIERRGEIAYRHVVERHTPVPAGRRLITSLVALGAPLAEPS